MKAKGRRMLSLDQWQTFSQPEAVPSTGRVDRSGVIVEAGKNQPPCGVSSSISPCLDTSQRSCALSPQHFSEQADDARPRLRAHPNMIKAGDRLRRQRG